MVLCGTQQGAADDTHCYELAVRVWFRHGEYEEGPDYVCERIYREDRNVYKKPGTPSKSTMLL